MHVGTVTLMVLGIIIVVALVVLSVAAMALGGGSPRDADRGGFEQHPGTGGPFSGGGPLE